MAYYDALITKWGTLTPGTTAVKLSGLNALTVAGPANAMVVPTYKIYNLIVPSEFVALTAANQQLVRDILGMGAVDASAGTSVRSRMVAIFPSGTATFTALSALAATFDTPQIPWWQANGYAGPIIIGDLAMASLESLVPWAHGPYVVSGPDANGNTQVWADFWDTANSDQTFRFGPFTSNAADKILVDNWAAQIMRTQANRAALAKLIV